MSARIVWGIVTAALVFATHTKEASAQFDLVGRSPWMPIVESVIDLERRNLGYSSIGEIGDDDSSGTIQIFHEYENGFIALQLKNPITHDREFVVAEIVYCESAEVRAETWCNKYKGWIYKTNFPKDRNWPTHIFISDQKSKSKGRGYPIAFYDFQKREWQHAFGADRGRPVGLHAPPAFLGQVSSRKDD